MRQATWALLTKDFRNLKWTLIPALSICVPLLILARVFFEHQAGPSFWITFFMASIFLFFRSFAQENTSKNFHLYALFRTSRALIFLSQWAVQALCLAILGIFIFLLTHLFWAQGASVQFEMLALATLALSPLGTFLGLILRSQREFLFILTYITLTTPVILACSQEQSSAWLSLVLAYALLLGFSSFSLATWLFDDLTQDDF